MGFYTTEPVVDRGVVIEKRAVRFFHGLHHRNTHFSETKSPASMAFHAVVLRTITPGVPLYGYRHLSTELGRWVSRDPIGEEGGLNVYAVAYNSPIVFIDPYGESAYIGTCASFLVGITVPVWGPWVATGAIVVGAGGMIYFELERRGAFQEIWEDFTSFCATCVSTGTRPIEKSKRETKWKKKKFRWTCKAKCNVQAIGSTRCPDHVFGVGGGSTQTGACIVAKRVATQSTPAGCYPRHCRCYDCVRH